MFTIIRRNDRLPEDRALTELRRAMTVSAARRIAHEVAYRFFEATDMLGNRLAHETIADILTWDGRQNLTLSASGQSFTLSVQ